MNNKVKAGMDFFHKFTAFKRFSSFLLHTPLFCEEKLIKSLCSTYIHEDEKDEEEKEGKAYSWALMVGPSLRAYARILISVKNWY